MRSGDQATTRATDGLAERLPSRFDETGASTPAASEIQWPFRPSAIPEHDRRDPRQILGNALVHAAAWGRAEVVDSCSLTAPK
jgi:hypothetical protein